MALAPKTVELPTITVKYVLLAQFVPCASHMWADQAKGVSVFRTQQPVYAFKPLPQEWPAGQMNTFNKPVKAFCCIDKGNCKITIQTDKQKYLIGEEIKVRLSLDNSGCSVPAQNIRLFLSQDFRAVASGWTT